MSRRLFLSINLASVLLAYSMMGDAKTAVNLKNPPTSPNNIFKDEPFDNNNKSFFNIAYLYIKPSSNNLKYATFVSGTQPYYQSWHYLQINPDFHSAFDVGFNYAIPHTFYSTAIEWVHLNSNDSSFKQASTSTDLETVQFVGPPYEMSPPVFGIKRVASEVNFKFDSILLNISELFEPDSHVQTRFFGGLNILNLKQYITTTFSDYAGSPATAYSYPLPPDPSFSFETENVSKYLGVGPDLGLNIRYTSDSGFGVFAEFLGSLTAGTVQTQDNFTSTSQRLTSVGIGVSHQEITSPNATQVVVGADGKLGIFYNYKGPTLPNLSVELGYRLANYFNAISMIAPNTLVQPGTVFVTPEFSTGTMAIVSTNATSHPFGFSGLFLNIKIGLG